ncbi:MAG: hypothetical protein RL095_510 [Verrucomicrobiota bacterium]|jgi:acetolactate synthase regulatory subunit
MNAPRHILLIGLEDRPGAVHAVAEVFSGRGLQMEAFQGSAGELCPDGRAQAIILFRATSERADLITRVLRRLSAVRSAELLAAEDPRVICSCLSRDPGPAPGLSFLPLGEAGFLLCGKIEALSARIAGRPALSPLRFAVLPR